ncbi:MAG: hypothetical protein ABWY18_01295 [Tardiphaga sp.]
MLTWRKCAIGVCSSKCLGLTSSNGAVRRALRNTDPLSRIDRNISASKLPPRSISGVAANDDGVSIIRGPEPPITFRRLNSKAMRQLRILADGEHDDQ